MKFVFASYVKSAQFNRPETWLKRINMYTGVLAALALQHQVISIEQIDYEGEFTENGVHYYFKRFSKAGRQIPFKMHRFIKYLQPDVIFIQGLHHPAQIIQLRLLMGSGVKIIAQNHAELPFKGPRKYLQRWADKYIDAYLFASHAMGLDWVRNGNLATPAKIHEVMEVSSVFGPMDRQIAKQRTGVTGDPVFLWVGRLNANKAPLTVVGAFLQFANSYPEARLYMIYQTHELLADLKHLLDQYSSRRNNVVLIGQVPHDDLGYWYNSADIFISGSYYEGSGTAVCEAMSCGCMPLVTDIFAFRMMTDNGNSGLLYEAGKQEALLAALKETMQINREEKKASALAWYQSNLSFGAIAGQIQRIAGSL